MVNKKEAFGQYYEAFWVIHQNYNIEDDAKTFCNKIDGHHLDESNSQFNLSYGNICVTIIKKPGSIPQISDVFEYWVKDGYYLVNIRR